MEPDQSQSWASPDSTSLNDEIYSATVNCYPFASDAIAELVQKRKHRILVQENVSYFSFVFCFDFFFTFKNAVRPQIKAALRIPSKM